MKKFSILCTFCLAFSALAYTMTDFDNAKYLADNGIITPQTTATKYRLDDKILRQEVIGMALKIKGVTVPENYTCKKYFADATKNDWICRAVELAADNGIISRSNKYANPGKSITRAEALAMVMKAGGVEILESIGISEGFAFYEKNGSIANSWQSDVLESARRLGIIDPLVKIEAQSVGDNPEFQQGYLNYYWRHNDLAIRGEVFSLTKNAYSLKDEKATGFIKWLAGYGGNEYDLDIDYITVNPNWIPGGSEGSYTNQNSKIRTFRISPDVQIKVGESTNNNISFNEFENIINSKDDYRKSNPWSIKIKNGIIVEIEEYYLP